MKILEAKNITKMFPGVIALDSVDVAFEPGEIHAIIGENGAGKSTLIKCLTGVYEPEEGEVMIGGENAMKNKALFDKVAYVPQEIDLFGYMSVAENLFIPYEKSGVKGTVNQKELEKRAIPILEKFSIPVKPNELVKDISISSQQLLQIARATVHEDYDVLMLDEPTTSLTSRDTKILFNIVEKIKKENKAIIFISHKLEEIFQLADVITVFRNGKKVAYSEIKDVDTNWVIKQMTGRELNQNERFYSTKVSDEVLLEVNNLTGERFTNVSFKLKKGEILGFSGLVGAGRSEVMQAIFGYLPVYKGSVKLDGADWKLGDTNYSVKNGFIYLPEERKKQGKEIHWIWDDTTPSIGEGDLLIATLGDGRIGHINYICERAKEAGAMIYVVTGSPSGDTAKNVADKVFFVPAAVYRGTDDVVPSFQPMGNLFEQCLLILFDIIIMTIVDETPGLTFEKMSKNHRNVE